VDKYLQIAADIKRSDLANYVSHRRVIIDLLAAAIRRQDDGSYAREDLIHTLIMPMRKDSNQTHFETCNLWLIDERLAFHDSLASDKPLSSSPITGATETKEPDILALNVFDNPMLVGARFTTPFGQATDSATSFTTRHTVRMGKLSRSTALLTPPRRSSTS
jgi:hypothetical protein